METTCEKIQGSDPGRFLWLFAGQLDAVSPSQARPEQYDLVCLAMQEPKYSSTGMRELMQAIARAKVPCMSNYRCVQAEGMRPIRGAVHGDIDQSRQV